MLRECPNATEEIRPIICSCVSGSPDDNCITSSGSLIGRDGWIMGPIDTLQFLHLETYVDRRRSDGDNGAETDASPHPTDRAGRPIAIGTLRLLTSEPEYFSKVKGTEVRLAADAPPAGWARNDFHMRPLLTCDFGMTLPKFTNAPRSVSDSPRISETTAPTFLITDAPPIESFRRAIGIILCGP